MPQHFQHHTWDTWPGWSTISANDTLNFTLWFTGLPGTGKNTLAYLLKKTLAARGYKTEIIDTYSLSRWLSLELSINEDIREDSSHTLGYDACITYICSLLARNGIISITTSVSPYQEARNYAREQLQHFIEVYLHCSSEQRQKRLEQQEHTSVIPAHFYQPPQRPELTINTGRELPERSALRIISYLEQHGFIAPLWEELDIGEEMIRIKARLLALGYLE
jgi:adenylylsulfate kinase-like enzyme